MKTKRLTRLKVIQTTDPEEFQFRFNEAIELLSDNEIEVNMQDFRGEHCAYITYTEVTREFDRISDEFHAEGIRYLCGQCSLHDPVEDGRQQHVWCKYSDCGMTHLKHEACELFYKKLKQNEIQPIY